jgi:hypothetical protein
LIHEQGSARYITLNRPKALNAMTIGMVETFLPWLQVKECALLFGPVTDFLFLGN